MNLRGSLLGLPSSASLAFIPLRPPVVSLSLRYDVLSSFPTDATERQRRDTRLGGQREVMICP